MSPAALRVPAVQFEKPLLKQLRSLPWCPSRVGRGELLTLVSSTVEGRPLSLAAHQAGITPDDADWKTTLGQLITLAFLKARQHPPELRGMTAQQYKSMLAALPFVLSNQLDYLPTSSAPVTAWCCGTSGCFTGSSVVFFVCSR